MNDRLIEPQLSAAEAYEQIMVPALFGSWAPRTAEAAYLRTGQRVLDVACGTGVLAREALERVGSSGYVCGIDANPGMLEVAARRAPQIDWRQGVAESLPLADESFDAVVSQFGLMFFDDREAALREALRVLRPGGRLVVAVWDALERNPAYDAEVSILQRTAGSAAADAIRAPYSMGDRSLLSGLFSAAGASEVDVTRLEGTGSFASVAAMIEADLRGWLPLVGILLSEEEISSVLEAAAQMLDRFVQEDGSVVFPTSVLRVTAVRAA